MLYEVITLMAARRPAGSLLQLLGVVDATDEHLRAHPTCGVALEAEVGIPDGEHLGIDAPVGVVAGRAPVAHGFVFKHVRTPLRRRNNFV